MKAIVIVGTVIALHLIAVNVAGQSSDQDGTWALSNDEEAVAEPAYDQGHSNNNDHGRSNGDRGHSNNDRGHSNGDRGHSNNDRGHSNNDRDHFNNGHGHHCRWTNCDRNFNDCRRGHGNDDFCFRQHCRQHC